MSHLLLHANGVLVAGQRILYYSFVFTLYLQHTNGRLVIRVAQNIINHILIHIKLTDKSRLKITGFQFNHYIASQLQMIK